MIGAVLDLVARRAARGDVVLRSEETVALSFEAGRLKATTFAQEEGTNLRVLADGRLGFAGTTTDDAPGLVDAALASAALGDTIDLAMPEPAPLPSVRTASPAAAAAGLDDLIRLGQTVVDRLAGDGRQVGVEIERAITSTRVANSSGLDAGFESTSVAVLAQVTRVAGDDVLIVSDYVLQPELPAAGELDRLVDVLRQRLAWADRPASAPQANSRVCFSPSGATVLLLPLEEALLGKSALQGISPLADRIGERMLDPSFTLIDDPLLPGRSGSRPCDDEGVPSRRLPLIDGGVVRACIYDLETAARAGTPSTGHGRRSIFGKPRAAYSNLALAPGSASDEELLALVGDGLLVDELLGVGQGNVIGGSFSHPVALAYRVEGGEVTGRVKDAAIAGDAYALLGRIVGLGKDQVWHGNQGVPALVLDGVSVTPR